MDALFFAAMASFLGGILSFLSPCVLPLVPGYICFAAGIGFDILDTPHMQAHMKRHILRNAASFVVGFSIIFIIAGAGASALNPLILTYKHSLSQIAGIAIILLGLYVGGIFQIPLFSRLLGRDYRFMRPISQSTHHPTYQLLIAFVLGLAFAFGWTPCIGPVLAGILTLAAGRESVGEGIMLLSIYAAGLGVPFMFAALATGHFLTYAKRIKAHMKWIQRATGLLLIITGIAIMRGTLQASASYLLEWFPFLAQLG